MKSRRFTDTSDFFSIDYEDEILIGGKTYVVKGIARESRFGMDDPKYWVKRVVDTETGKRKIIKLTFLESFEITLGGVRIRCFRSPDKEGKILDLVQGHLSFMHGKAYRDEKGNNVRILEVVSGPTFYAYIHQFTMMYEEYFYKVLPGILKNLVEAFEAVRFLHLNDFKHGDIRNDHIIVNRERGKYVWIDFDYDYEATENPFGLDILGLGNILTYAVGKGFHTVDLINREKKIYGDLIDRIEPKDMSILDRRRFVNLKKLFPIIPKSLNDILLHFSQRAEIYYELVEEMIEDLNRCLYTTFE